MRMREHVRSPLPYLKPIEVQGVGLVQDRSSRDFFIDPLPRRQIEMQGRTVIVDLDLISGWEVIDFVVLFIHKHAEFIGRAFCDVAFRVNARQRDRLL